MKKLLLACLVIAAILSVSAFASDASVTNSSYVITNDGEFEVSFDVSVDSAVTAVLTAYDNDGRLLGSKIVPVGSSDTYSAAFDDYKTIGFVKVNLFEKMDTIKPVCVQSVVENFARNGDSDIFVGTLFQ